MHKKINFNRAVIGILGAFALLLTLTGCKCDKKKVSTVNNEQQDVEIDKVGTIVAGTLDPSTGNFIYDTGDIFAIKLPNEVEIVEVGKNSTEAKLFNFLSDSTVVINEDKTKGWITLDRVYFDTGKSALTEESNKQLKNISEILKAFPKTRVKIGGYTDNTGSEDTNKKVSAERAKIVQEELTKLGIEARRITSEGYGPEHPVCEANDTPECKAQNRRVDIRVFEK